MGQFVSPRPSQIKYQNPNTQCNGIRRWGLWEVIRSWGGALMNGISALIKRALESLLTPSTMWGFKKLAVCNLEEGLHQHLPLDFQLLNCENKFLMPPSLWYSTTDIPSRLRHPLNSKGICSDTSASPGGFAGPHPQNCLVCRSGVEVSRCCWCYIVNDCLVSMEQRFSSSTLENHPGNV